jgi:hypothetical protein
MQCIHVINLKVNELTCGLSDEMWYAEEIDLCDPCLEGG